MNNERSQILVEDFKTSEHAKGALHEILKIYKPDTLIQLPVVGYNWERIQLRYKIEDVTVVVDAIKITVNSQSGESVFGFDDIRACLRLLEQELITKRTQEELFIRKIWEVYHGIYRKQDDVCILVMHQDNIEVTLKAQSGVCVAHVVGSASEDSVPFIINTDLPEMMKYLNRYLIPIRETEAKPTDLFS